MEAARRLRKCRGWYSPEMKKIVYAAIAAAFLAGAVSCKFTHAEKELEKPGVSVENGAIIVSVPKRKKTDYINVFRRAAGMEAQKVNIGQITPGEEDSMLSYTFRDALVASGQKYQYALRYKVRSSYMMTDWSAGVTALSAAATAPAAAVGGGAKLVFDADAKRLTLSGGTLTPSDAAALAEYTLKIALKTDKKSTLFTLPAAKGTGLADGAVLELGSILSADFFDTEITFIGFVLLWKKRILQTTTR